MRRKLLMTFVGLGMLAQLLVPAWMLLKHHLILTRGEQVTVDVTFYDPRDLFMGHYVRLSISGSTPEALDGVPTNYLRYYCDQRYAKAIDQGVREAVAAELDVRVWRGSALATELRINGMPAYAYVDQQGDVPSSAEEQARINETRPDLNDAVCVEAVNARSCPPQARFVVVGKNLTWTPSNTDEGFFFRREGEPEDLIACEILEDFKTGIGYLLRPTQPLQPQGRYHLIFKYRRDDKLFRETNWCTFQIISEEKP